MYTRRARNPCPSPPFPTSHKLKTHSISSSQYSLSPGQITPESGRNNLHGYPYSLLGLHALPTTYSSHGTSTLPSVSSFESDSEGKHIAAKYIISSRTVRNLRRQFHHPCGCCSRADRDGGYSFWNMSFRPLGVLDGVLSFIAVERERGAK